MDKQDIPINDDEQIDDLQFRGLYIIQKRDSFRYGTDGVLLANYASRDINANNKAKKRGDAINILDIGTGTGIVPILLCAKLDDSIAERAIFRAVEIQPHIAEMATRSVAMNNQQDKIHIDVGDVMQMPYGKATMDFVTMNPPYVRKQSGLQNRLDTVALARHEIVCTQEELIAQAAQLLSVRGRLYMVNNPDRLADTLYTMRCNRIEPRELTMVHARADAAPVLFLVTGVRCGGKNLRITPPIILENVGG